MTVRPYDRTWVLPLLALVSCGRSPLDEDPRMYWECPDPTGSDVPDAPPDSPSDGLDGSGDDADATEDGAAEFAGLSCTSAALCAVCCPEGDWLCQIGCLMSSDPGSQDEVSAVLECAVSASCGNDVACLFEECREEIDACGSGGTGTGGCVELATCLVSAGCDAIESCVDQATCYQVCFGEASPEAISASRELMLCLAGSCTDSCGETFDSVECLFCLGTSCGEALGDCMAI